MIVAVIAAGIGGVAVVTGWIRWSSSRALRRSVEGYEKALDVLGEVAKHADQAPTLTSPTGDPAHPPIALSISPPPPPEPPRRRLAPPLPLKNRETFVPGESIARHPSAQPILPARRLNPPIPPGGRSPAIAPGGGHAQADEPLPFPPEESTSSEAPEQAPEKEREPVGAALAATGPAQQFHELAARRRAAERVGHRVIAASAAVVVFVGAIVGAVVLTSHSAPPSTAGTTPPVHHHGHHRTAPPSPPPAPTSYSPQKVTPQTVTFVVPSGAFTITMQAVGTCWLGIESSAGGPYLWMDTLRAGGSTSYHASGTVVLRIGAPAQLSVSIDGVPLQLPARNVNPYDAVIETTSNAATTA